MLEPDTGCSTLNAVVGGRILLPKGGDDLLVVCSGIIWLSNNAVVICSAALDKSALEINVG